MQFAWKYISHFVYNSASSILCNCVPFYEIYVDTYTYKIFHLHIIWIPGNGIKIDSNNEHSTPVAPQWRRSALGENFSKLDSNSWSEWAVHFRAKVQKAFYSVKYKVMVNAFALFRLIFNQFDWNFKISRYTLGKWSFFRDIVSHIKLTRLVLHW